MLLCVGFCILAYFLWNGTVSENDLIHIQGLLKEFSNEGEDIPPEAYALMRDILSGYHHSHLAGDGRVFKNYENRLPPQPKGYYREFTLMTPGVRHRGARRVISGGYPVIVEFFFSPDHYKSFAHVPLEDLRE